MPVSSLSHTVSSTSARAAAPGDCTSNGSTSDVAENGGDERQVDLEAVLVGVGRVVDDDGIVLEHQTAGGVVDGYGTER